MAQLKDVITVDDSTGLKRTLGQKAPALVLMTHGKNDKPLIDALSKTAQKYGDDLLVILADVSDAPDIPAKYDAPELPAIITLTKSFFGRKIKATAGSVRPADIRAHVAHLIDDEPLPEPKTKTDNSSKGGGTPVTVTDATWRKEVLRSKTPVLVDFWAPWCAPCRTIAPYIEQVAGDYQGKLKVVKLDTDANPVISRRYSIRSIPTIAIFEGGQPVAQISGANPGAIRRMIESQLQG